MQATTILDMASDAIGDRAASRDLPEGERSMERTVKAFNALMGTELTTLQGWFFMSLLKSARATAGAYNPDDYVDLAGYASLAGEEAANADIKTKA